MKLKISFKHLDHSASLDERIREKSEKLEKYFQGNIQIQWTCWVDESKQWAEIKVHGPKFDFFAKASSDSLYKSLDLAIDKIERQVEKKKDIRRNKIHLDHKDSIKNKEIKKIIHDEEEFARKYFDEKSA